MLRTVGIVFWIVVLGCLSTALAAQCNITSSPLAFGSYDTLSPTPLDSSAALNISCKPKQAFLVTVQLSPGNSGNFAQRAMIGPTTLLYNIFTDPSMSNVIGDGSGGSTTLTRSVDRSTPWNLTLFGRIPALQTVPVGVYSDALTATILW